MKVETHQIPGDRKPASNSYEPPCSSRDYYQSHFVDVAYPATEILSRNGITQWTDRACEAKSTEG